MNVIFLMNDTLRADHINAYQRPAPWKRPGHETQPFIETPHLDRLAQQSALFDRCYVGSYPTIPNRHDIATGRFGFPTIGWEPLKPDEVVLAERLESRGYVSMMIFDTPPLANDDYNFTRGFTAWDWVRGQHRDRWITDPVDIPLPTSYKTKSPTGLQLYLLNATRRQYGRDWMCAKTALAACDWLERNKTRDQFFLWVDMWDPHDPFEAPTYDMARYADPNYRGVPIIYPKYGRADYMTPEELNDVRARYAAKVQFVDRSVGRILDCVQAVGLDRNTLIIHTTDHGHLFGEHGLQGKPTGPLGRLYEPTTRIPLLIRHPEGLGKGRRIDAIVQPPDVTATILAAAGMSDPDIQGESLFPLMAGTSAGSRTYAFSGRFSRQVNILTAGATAQKRGAASFDGWVGIDATSEPITVTTDEWSLIVSPIGGPPPELYHLTDDPQQQHNVYTDHSKEAEQLHHALLNFLTECGASKDRIAAYTAESNKGLSVAQAMPLSTLVYSITIAGRPYAFLTEDEALANRIDDSPIETMTLDVLQSIDAHAMVCIGDQYYWVTDVALATRSQE